jgi:pSer/pThr/pTyr-binding forkhead associated (FHA) protein
VEGQRYLVDLKSTHGTFLESKRLKPNEPAKWPEGGPVNSQLRGE